MHELHRMKVFGGTGWREAARDGWFTTQSFGIQGSYLYPLVLENKFC
jgi:hypothetical protein